MILKYKIAIFIDGEFWHGYNWEEKKRKIVTNKKYWVDKIEKNIQRDIINNKKLHELGYSVIRFWEKEIKKELNKCVDTVIETVKHKMIPS